MKTMSKSMKNLEKAFKNDAIETAKMNHLVGGGGDGDSGQGGNGEW